MLISFSTSICLNATGWTYFLMSFFHSHWPDYRQFHPRVGTPHQCPLIFGMCARNAHPKFMSNAKTKAKHLQCAEIILSSGQKSAPNTLFFRWGSLRLFTSFTDAILFRPWLCVRPLFASGNENRAQKPMASIWFCYQTNREKKNSSTCRSRTKFK